MEQTSYWMWARNKLIPERVPSATHVNHEYSWEEQAFAEDSAGPHGGCIWPPRSYTCSFCRREFRSAQALGGHMNVHRRDRARLKQPPSTPPPPPSHHENNIIYQNPFTSSTSSSSSSSLMSTAIQHPSSKVSTSLVYSPLMNNPNLVVTSSPNRVSPPSSTQENSSCVKQTLVSPYSYTSSIVHNESLFPTPLTRSEPITTARFLIAVSDSSKQLLEQEDQNLRERETAAGILRLRVHDHKLNSSEVSLNLVSYSPNRPTARSDDDEEDESMISNKRRKTSNTTLPFFLKANFIDRDRLKSDGIGLINKQSSMEDDQLDLELRLGA